MSQSTSADDSRQTTIDCGDPVPSDPSDELCEWCDRPAVRALELRTKVGGGQVPTGTFLYACAAHTATAREVVAVKAETKRKL